MSNASNRIKELNRQEIIAAARNRLGKKKVLKRAPVMQFPINAERSYVRFLNNLASAMTDLVDKILIPELENILTAAELKRPNFDSVRLDAPYDYVTQIANLMSLIEAAYADHYSELDVEVFVARIAKAIADQNGKQLGKVFASVLGVDPFIVEPWLATELKAFVKQNVDLIVTLPRRFFPEIEQMVFRAAREGRSWRELKKEIKGRYHNSHYNAERIARDQVGKFNGQLTMLRQAQAGVTRYIWRTVRDARVRDEHKEREGKSYSWDDPPGGENPGDAIMCRCYAEPDLSNLLNF